jgi:multiple sugar transport system substrate-binding protein
MSASLSRRRLLAGVGALAGSAILPACGKSAQSKNTITLLNDENTDGTPLGEAIKAFEKQSGKKVEVQPAPSDYDTKMRTVLASPAPPDVMRVNDDYVRGLSDDGVLLDLGKYIKRDHINAADYATKAFNFPTQPDGRHTAWVIGYSPRVIYYNVDWFKSAGVQLPPGTWTDEHWTWDDFLDAAKKLTKGTNKWGALVYLDTGYEQTFSINNGSATGIFSANGKQFTLADPKGIEAVEWATDLTTKYQVQPPWSVLQGVNVDTTFFTQQKVAMLFDTFQVTPYFRDNVKNFTWDIAPPPGKVNQDTESSMIVYGIPKKSKNPDGAWELLNFLAGPDGGAVLAKGKEFTPVNNKAGETVKADAKSPAHLGLFAEAVHHMTQPNQTTNTLGARDLYRPPNGALADVYGGKKSPSEVLNTLRPKINKVLSESPNLMNQLGN